MLKTVSDADSLFISNMGHDLPDSKIDEMTHKMTLHFEQASNKE